LSDLTLPTREHVQQVIDADGLLNVEASRGCNWGRCKYCCISDKYGELNWRGFSVDRVMEDLKDLSEKGVKNPYFTDEDFIGPDPDRIIELSRRIIEAKKNGTINPEMIFFVSVRARSIVPRDSKKEPKVKEMLELMKEAGFYDFFLGIESGSKGQLSRYCKEVSPEENLKAIQIVNEVGFCSDLGFIMFDPLMSADEILENINFIRHAGISDHDSRVIKKLRIMPSTPMERKYLADGIISADDLDVNDQQYSYSFKDPKVQDIYDFISAWEEETEDLVYELQHDARGEHNTLEERRARRVIIGELRSLQLDLLEALTKGEEPDLKSFNDKRSVIVSIGKKLLSSNLMVT